MGSRIAGQYEVLAVHAEGAMGLVYQVRHLAWGVDLAVKSPRPQLFGNEADRQRFVREAETWVSLGLHPHVCNCHYVRTLDGIPRVFAEYVDGGSLRQWIDDGRLYQGEPSEVLTRILDVAVQTARGLRHSHRHDIVHQDVKPANVLMTRDGDAKVTDFGLARARPPDGSVESPSSAGHGRGTVLVTTGGMTPGYASPEQASGRQVSRRSDVWSLAVSVLEMFTGEVTWLAGPAAGAALDSLRRSSTGLRVPMPDSVAEVLAHCLREDPAQRPAGMDDVASALADAYANEVGSPYPRKQPSEADLRADELNNRALSLLDLELYEDAEAAFGQALEADPLHAGAIYNAGLQRWRAGSIDDQALVTELERLGENTDDPYLVRHLLGQVHLERGDPETALPLFEAAVRQAPDDQVLLADLRAAKSGDHAGSHVVATLTTDGGEPAVPVGVSEDAQLAVSVADTTVSIWQVSTGNLLYAFAHTGTVTCYCLSRNGRWLVTGTAPPDGRRDGQPSIHVFRTDTGQHLRSILTGHRYYITSLHVGDDAHYAMSLCETDATARLWDLESGREVDRRGAICASAVANFAVSGGLDGTVCIWHLGEGGKLLGCIPAHERPVGAISMSLEGRFVISSNLRWVNQGVVQPGTMRLWDMHSAECLHTINPPAMKVGGAVGHDHHVVRLATGGQIAFATGDREGIVTPWDTRSGRELGGLGRHEFGVSAIQLNADASMVMTESPTEPSERPWQLATLIDASGATNQDIVVNRPLDDAVRPPTPGRAVRLWQTTGRCWHTLRGHALLGTRGALLTGDRHGNVRMWASPRVPYEARFHVSRPSSHTRLADLQERANSLISAARQAEADEAFATALELLEQARRIPGWERAPAALEAWHRLAMSCTRIGARAVIPVRTHETHPGFPVSVRITPDSRLVLIARLRDRSISVRDPRTGLGDISLHGRSEHGPAAVQLSPDGRLAIGGAEDDGFRIWEIATGRTVTTIQPQRQTRRPASGLAGLLEAAVEGNDQIAAVTTPNDVVDAALSGDGRIAVVASAISNSLVRVFDVPTGQCLRVVHQETGTGTVALSPDARRLLSAGDRDPQVRVWDVATGRHLRRLQGHSGGVTDVRLSADAELGISAGTDATVRVWDVTTGRCRHVLTGHEERATSACLSADGRFALSGGNDGLRLWELEHGRCLQVIRDSGPLTSVDLSADGRLAVAGGKDGSMYVWEIDWELAAREPADWDDGARPLLTMFLSVNTPPSGQAPATGEVSEEQARSTLTRHGEPSFEDTDFEMLLEQLRCAGYGWLRADGVRAELDRMARQWSGPPSLPG